MTSTEYARPARGLETPWGPAQTVHELAPGLLAVSTASHGGLWLDAERWAHFCKGFPDLSKGTKYSPPQWLEEDCDCRLAFLLWPEVFGMDRVPRIASELADPKAYLHAETRHFFKTARICLKS